ncbi:MAG: hypothetical protein JW760_09745 [Spirochaetales bacterium]|nr:hypothetical protein [Spirochaetales bacterium]
MKKTVGVGTLILLLLITGCATSVRMVVTKPAEVNLAGVKNLSILDFEYVESTSEVTLDKLLEDALSQLITGEDTSLSNEEKMARYATNKMSESLAATDYFTLVDPGNFKDSVDIMTNRMQFFDILSGVYDVDGVLLGSILTMKTKETWETRIVMVLDELTGQEVEQEEEWVTRQANLEFEYRILSTDTSEVMVQKVFTRSTSDAKSYEEYDRLTSEDLMYKRMVDEIVRTITRQLVPYQVTESRSLMKDKTKDQRMETADQFVKVAKYNEALEIFLSVWQQTRNIAAGFNAAIMYEALGNLDQAIVQMNDVLNVYPEKKVFRSLERLKAAKVEREKAMAQLEGR